MRDVLRWYDEGGERGESSWLAWAFLSRLPGPVTVLHSVRNPWRVVDSLCNRNDIIQPESVVGRDRALMRRPIYAFCPEVFDYETAIDRAAAMVVHWNRKIEEAAAASRCEYYRYCVEDIDARFIQLTEQILGWLGIYRDSYEIERAISEVPRNVNGGKQIDYNVQITNPLIKAYIAKAMPGIPPVIRRGFSTACPQTPDEIETNMDDGLREQLGALAERYGYSRTELQEQANVGEQCANV